MDFLTITTAIVDRIKNTQDPKLRSGLIEALIIINEIQYELFLDDEITIMDN